MTWPMPRHAISLEQILKRAVLYGVCCHMSTRGIRFKGLGLVGVLNTLLLVGEGFFF